MIWTDSIIIILTVIFIAVAVDFLRPWLLKPREISKKNIHSSIPADVVFTKVTSTSKDALRLKTFFLGGNTFIEPPPGHGIGDCRLRTKLITVITPEKTVNFTTKHSKPADSLAWLKRVCAVGKGTEITAIEITSHIKNDRQGTGIIFTERFEPKNQHCNLCEVIGLKLAWSKPDMSKCISVPPEQQSYALAANY